MAEHQRKRDNPAVEAPRKRDNPAVEIGAVKARDAVSLDGKLIQVHSFTHPWIRLDAVLQDPTGHIVLRWLGREAVPGIEVGASLRASGTALAEGDHLVVLNPIYSFD